MRVYLSHSIRGKEGDKATAESMWVNNLKAKHFAEQLRLALRPLPIEIYVPAEHDEAISNLYLNKDVTISAILKADCDILTTCDVLLLFEPDNYRSAGMKVEYKFAQEHNMDTYTVCSHADIIDAAYWLADYYYHAEILS